MGLLQVLAGIHILQLQEKSEPPHTQSPLAGLGTISLKDWGMFIMGYVMICHTHYKEKVKIKSYVTLVFTYKYNVFQSFIQAQISE